MTGKPYKIYGYKGKQVRDQIHSIVDTGGVDPAGNTGVYNFKKGLGGRLSLNGPLWVYGSGRIITSLCRAFLSLRG
jgi:hypothetical protein